MKRTLALVGFAIVFATSSYALAQDTDGVTPTVDMGLRGGTLVSTEIFAPEGFLYGAEAHYHLSPAFRAGAYVQKASVESSSSDHDNEKFNLLRGGLRFEAHSRPIKTIDPWVGLSLGVFRELDNKETGLDSSLDAGVDFHLGKGFHADRSHHES